MLQDYRCRVLVNRLCGHNLFWMRLQPVDGHFSCRPGQFVMVDLPDPRFFFRRPFSVLDVQPDGSFDVYYKVVGAGTAMLSALPPGAALNVLGPLGNSFTPPQPSQASIVIGGGIGIAPLYFLGKQLKAQGEQLPTCFYGVRSEAELGMLTELTEVFGGDRLFVSTNDGSYGRPGFVTDQLAAQSALVETADVAYICGPTVMMQAVSAQLLRVKPALRIEVSLEEHMPCGTGACTGCVVERADQLLPSKVCVEGPVFEARQVCWPGSKEAAACPS